MWMDEGTEREREEKGDGFRIALVACDVGVVLVVLVFQTCPVQGATAGGPWTLTRLLCTPEGGYCGELFRALAVQQWHLRGAVAILGYLR